MGKLVRKVLVALGLRRARAKLLIIGLDNSGKSTLAALVTDAAAASGESSPRDVQPTVGYSIDDVNVSRGLRLTVVDMSGQSVYHDLWETYYGDVQGVAFVVDAADPRRFPEVGAALAKMAKHADLQRTPLLLFSNKMDLAMAPPAHEVAKSVGLDDLGRHWVRPWRLQGCSALTGEGVQDGLKWLTQNVKKKA